MRIAVINETSAADKNGDILSALDGHGHEIINAGMTKTGAEPSMTYIQTGLLSALLLNAKRVDLVVGGCGTGQGFMNSAMQYPNVFCGLIQDPSDAWLFTQINGGNCISLALNKGYGWAADINLGFIFERFFSVESGKGYPPHRQESQQESLAILRKLSTVAHRSMAEIIGALDDEVVMPVLEFPGTLDILDLDSLENAALKEAVETRIG